MPLLKRFRPVLVTDRVSREQARTAPPRAQDQFRAALREGWITIHPAAAAPAVERVIDEIVGLSRTDAELLVLAERTHVPLFTDETLLARAAEKRGVTVYDVVDTLLMLRELGDLDDAGLKRTVFAIHSEDGRRFTPSEFDALGLPGFF